ncbi:unnamed protein product [Triticum turgidum subsp. durum]|uniref:Peptidase A1 domain-containing protein n=1 Tax=Triticum turgidum subsp. durum TaxID=4567 RepID=A0A9R1C389_TRITD|nr:unnamed protein product [Triticum turgidum subsp. durum]
MASYVDALQGFRFGCGEKNSGLFGKTAGLMGLGRGKTSLTVQAYDNGYKTAPAYSILDTCYDFTGLSDVSLPTVSLVFQGGTCLDVDVSGIVYAISQAQVCLAFASNGDDESVAIIGNTQQKTYGVLYDLGKKTVGFAPGSC